MAEGDLGRLLKKATHGDLVDDEWDAVRKVGCFLYLFLFFFFFFFTYFCFRKLRGLAKNQMTTSFCLTIIL